MPLLTAKASWRNFAKDYSTYTETENYDYVSPEMSAMMNDHAVSITTTNLVRRLKPVRFFADHLTRIDALPELPFRRP